MDLTGPGAPLDNPLAWTILAWTRRTFFNEPNDAATPAAVNATATAVTPIVQEPVAISSPNASGAVTVKIVATDPLGRPLTYWVLTPPAPATGAVTTNATPGEFTYTPTTDARVSAATGGPTTDTFTIAVAPTANPNVFTTVTITAPVKPATGTLTLTAEANDPNCLGTSCGPDLIRTVVYEGTLSTTTDPSGIPVAYSVTDGPKYGEVHIDPTTGTWTYTPTIEAVNATWLGPGLTGFLPDSFKAADDLPASGSFGSAAIVGDPENNLPGGDPELAEHVWVWDGARWSTVAYSGRSTHSRSLRTTRTPPPFTLTAASKSLPLCQNGCSTRTE